MYAGVQVNADGVFKYAYIPWFAQALQVLALSGVHGVAVDIWVSAAEAACVGNKHSLVYIHCIAVTAASTSIRCSDHSWLYITLAIKAVYLQAACCEKLLSGSP